MFLTVEEALQFHEALRARKLQQALRAERERERKRRFRRDRCFNRFRVLPLDQIRGLPIADKSTTDSGVYFLWNGPQLTYIGKGNCVRDRLSFHAKKGKYFTHATYELLLDSCARLCEADYINRYWPPLNRKAG